MIGKKKSDMTLCVFIIDENVHNGAIDEIYVFSLKLQIELPYKCIVANTPSLLYILGLHIYVCFILS